MQIDRIVGEGQRGILLDRTCDTAYQGLEVAYLLLRVDHGRGEQPLLPPRWLRLLKRLRRVWRGRGDEAKRRSV